MNGNVLAKVVHLSTHADSKALKEAALQKVTTALDAVKVEECDHESLTHLTFSITRLENIKSTTIIPTIATCVERRLDQLNPLALAKFTVSFSRNKYDLTNNHIINYIINKMALYIP